MAYRYLKGKRERDYDISPDGTSSKLKKPQTFAKMDKDVKSSMRALRTIEKAKKTNEEVEDLDETAKIVAHLQKRYGDNIRKSHVRSAANDFGVDASKLAKAVRTKLGKNMLDEEQIDELSKKTLRDAGGKMLRKGLGDGSRADKHMKSANLASAKLYPDQYKNSPLKAKVNATEEVEQIDELSKGTMGRYINKAKDSIDIVSYRQGHKEAHGSSAAGAEKKLTKRHKGISTAVSKLTKEEQDFVDALNDEIFEKADPYDIAGMIKKAKAKNDPNHPAMKHVAAIEDMKKNGGALSVQGDHVRSLIKALGEEVEITEARGRPRKAGAKDFTIHPKTKEKLMHNNPEHMKKIEVLQKNGILEKPKVEAGQHIMNQLRKAKTSMLGGSKINFTHGDSKEVSGTHAAKILTKYAGMKPDEKEDFQKFVGHSHENLMKHV
jgi:hypothetical protein